MKPRPKTIRKVQRKQEQFRTFLMKPIYRLQQRHYDRRRDNNIKVEAGKLPLCDNVVVLLIYQPHGLPKSIFHTLDNIKSEGLSAFVILNSDLGYSDNVVLKENCSLIMKRPNFGYDFGGYRDAIMHLAAEERSFKSITCMNDSIWFPVFKNCDHLSEMLNVKGHLVGYSYCELRKGKHAHLQSYLFTFKGENFLKSAYFLNYWSELQVSNSRHFTIRNSELEMMGFFKSRDHTIGWLFSATDLIRYYEKSADHEIIDAVKYLKETGHHSASLFDNTSEEDVVGQRRILISGIKSGKLYRSVIGGEPGMVFRGLKFAAMKKSKASIYQAQRERSVDRGICERFEPSIRNEITFMGHEPGY